MARRYRIDLRRDTGTPRFRPDRVQVISRFAPVQLAPASNRHLGQKPVDGARRRLDREIGDRPERSEDPDTPPTREPGGPDLREVMRRAIDERAVAENMKGLHDTVV